MVFRERVPDVRFYRGFCALQNHRYFASIGGFFYLFVYLNNAFLWCFVNVPHTPFFTVFAARC